MEVGGPEMGLVYSWSFGIDLDGRAVGNTQTGDAEGDVYDVLLMDFVIGNGSCQLFRREALDRVGFYSTAVGTAEDFDLCLRVAEHYRVGFVPELHVGYRQVPGSVSRNVDRMWRSYLAVAQAALTRDPALGRDVLRWSRSNTLAYLAGHAYDAEVYGRALQMIGRTVLTDPAVLLASWPWRLAARSLLHVIGIRARTHGAQEPGPMAVPHEGARGLPVEVPSSAMPHRQGRMRAWWKPSVFIEARRLGVAERRARERAAARRQDRLSSPPPKAS
jgi:hypothetical protein